jgi:hypothetical protein
VNSSRLRVPGPYRSVLNVQTAEDCAELREAIMAKVREIRRRRECEIDALVATIDRTNNSLFVMGEEIPLRR